jgi:hypothetical protein
MFIVLGELLVFSFVRSGARKAPLLTEFGKCVYGSVPRAVASVLQVESRSLPLAVLIRRPLTYTQAQTAIHALKTESQRPLHHARRA